MKAIILSFNRNLLWNQLVFSLTFCWFQTDAACCLAWMRFLCQTDLMIEKCGKFVEKLRFQVAVVDIRMFFCSFSWFAMPLWHVNLNPQSTNQSSGFFRFSSFLFLCTVTERYRNMHIHTYICANGHTSKQMWNIFVKKTQKYLEEF